MWNPSSKTKTEWYYLRHSWSRISGWWTAIQSHLDPCQSCSNTWTLFISRLKAWAAWRKKAKLPPVRRENKAFTLKFAHQYRLPVDSLSNPSAGFTFDCEISMASRYPHPTSCFLPCLPPYESLSLLLIFSRMLGGSRAFIPLVGPLPFIPIRYLPTAIHGKTRWRIDYQLAFQDRVSGVKALSPFPWLL